MTSLGLFGTRGGPLLNNLSTPLHYKFHSMDGTSFLTSILHNGKILLQHTVIHKMLTVFGVRN